MIKVYIAGWRKINTFSFFFGNTFLKWILPSYVSSKHLLYVSIFWYKSFKFQQLALISLFHSTCLVFQFSFCWYASFNCWFVIKKGKSGMVQLHFVILLILFAPHPLPPKKIRILEIALKFFVFLTDCFISALWVYTKNWHI